jgi:20S proteasome subunit alpha 4
MGVDSDKTPKLYSTDPSGIYAAWKANAIGRNAKTVREFLEKNHEANMDKAGTLKLAVRALLEVVQTGASNIEIAYMQGHDPTVHHLPVDEVQEIVNIIEKEKEAEAEKKKSSSSSMPVPTM